MQHYKGLYYFFFIKMLLITYAILIMPCALSLNVNLLHLERKSFHALFNNEDDELLLIMKNEHNITHHILSLGNNINGLYLQHMSNGLAIFEFNNGTTLSLKIKEINSEDFTVDVDWKTLPGTRIQKCVNLGDNHWYGGPQQKRQYWPIEMLNLTDYSYVTKSADNCGIAEPYWLSSTGLYYYIDKSVPLFVDQNRHNSNSICFIADIKPPYSVQRSFNNLAYTVGFFRNAKDAHKHAVAAHFGKPSGHPDERMIKHPIWSTWARYKKDINHKTVIEFANEIIDNRFSNSQIEIDDLWEICYGSLTVDEKKFPDFRSTNRQLKAMGFRVSLWIHPFINKGCEPWYSDALKLGFLVVSENGTVETSWWNNNGTMAAYIDFTNEDARDWWLDRLNKLRDRFEIDSFKFDAGETSWSPQIPKQSGDILEHPSHITIDYVNAVAQFGSMIEIRTGQRTQHLPVFVRMIDKDTYWTFENGLPILITTLLQMNLNGYPFVLPDMIGGNGYNGPPSKELFIRWLQANVFMPSLQFSYVPWDFDKETVEISYKFTALHTHYSSLIIDAMLKAEHDGTPVNPPIWWLDPTDKTALGIWDEFLLGDTILAAPVLEEGAQSRDVYLPQGIWLAEGNPDRVVQGPKWLRSYRAPLDTLPYFVKKL